MGNIFGRWEGSEPNEGVVLTGSHCDAIPLAGAAGSTRPRPCPHARLLRHTTRATRG